MIDGLTDSEQRMIEVWRTYSEYDLATLPQLIIKLANMVEAQAEEAYQLRVQLAGCSVAAFGYAKGDQDAELGDFGYSVPFADVKLLYAKYVAKDMEVVRLRRAMGEAIAHLDDRWAERDVRMDMVRVCLDDALAGEEEEVMTPMEMFCDP